jgi:hypothetical protein
MDAAGVGGSFRDTTFEVYRELKQRRVPASIAAAPLLPGVLNGHVEKLERGCSLGM